MQILRATCDDIPWIAGQLRDFTSSLNTKHAYIPPDDVALHCELASMLDHVLLVAWSGSERAGTIGGILVPHPFNSSVKTLFERFWWVPESRRRSKAGYLLLRAFTKIAEQVADSVVVSLETISPVNDRALTRLGLKLKELSYAKEF